ncbi:hypothetical protein [Rhodoferax sp. GW822-FHT02A01]|uniref:hypothetical protein n=1 Tax=Rhodoferax sp. GW822-FHT02A01 TaxID=3141537 RepID=UPI00315DF1EB
MHTYSRKTVYIDFRSQIAEQDCLNMLKSNGSFLAPVSLMVMTALGTLKVLTNVSFMVLRFVETWDKNFHSKRDPRRTYPTSF